MSARQRSPLGEAAVRDIDAVYREWSARGAQFMTAPMNNRGFEFGCYLRDPDGYLIEVGQTLSAAES